MEGTYTGKQGTEMLCKTNLSLQLWIWPIYGWLATLTFRTYYYNKVWQALIFGHISANLQPKL